jgi:type I restriction enzyme, S subunit
VKVKSQSLSDIADVIAGQSPTSDLYNSAGEGLPFYQGKTDFGTKYPTERSWCKGNGHKIALENDILLSVRAPVGPVNICQKQSIIGRGIAAIRPKKGFSFEYIYYFFKYNENKIAKLGTGSTFKAITKTDINKLKIPLPDTLNDQIRIATVLTCAENLIAKRKESIKALDELLKSTFLEMFGPANKDYLTWPLTEIKDLAAHHKRAMRTGPFGSNLLHGEFTISGDVAVLGIDNAVQNKFAWDQRRFITMEKYNELSSYRVFPGDVIITIMGTIGRAAVIPDDIPLSINTKHLAAITLDRKKANPVFLAYSIHSSPFIHKQFASKNRGAIMNGLNLGLIKETKIRKPPIDLQNQFAAIVEKVEYIKSKYTLSLTELENLYGSLSQRAFKGELDVGKIPADVHSVERT